MIKMIKVEDLLKFYNWNITHISMGKCHQLKEEGYLHMNKHVKYPLYLLNYTSKTQYQQKWCKELIHTRGMVVCNRCASRESNLLVNKIPQSNHHSSRIVLINVSSRVKG